MKQGAQIGVGAALIFAAERSLWAAAQAMGVRIPTAPAGMMMVFAALLVIHAVSPKTAGQITDWFGPARTFYSKGVPLFFSPPLVQLPLSLGILPLLTIFKYISLIATGTFVSIIATGLAVSALVSAPNDPTTCAESAPEVGTNTISKATVVARTSPVLKTAVASMAVFAGKNVAPKYYTHAHPPRHALMGCHITITQTLQAHSFLHMIYTRRLTSAHTVLRIDALLIASSSVAALQFGKALPSKIRAVCPAVITCGALTAVMVSFLGMLRGVEASAGAHMWVYMCVSMRVGLCRYHS